MNYRKNQKRNACHTPIPFLTNCSEFPNSSKMGMSVSNLWAMKKYYVRFHLSDPKLQRSVGVLPWRHINQLMTKLL